MPILQIPLEKQSIIIDLHLYEENICLEEIRCSVPEYGKQSFVRHVTILIFTFFLYLLKSPIVNHCRVMLLTFQ